MKVKITNLRYFIKEGFLNFNRSIVTSIISVITISVVMSVFGFFSLSSSVIQKYADVNLRKYNRVDFYINNDIDKEKLDSIIEKIKSALKPERWLKIPHNKLINISEELLPSVKKDIIKTLNLPDCYRFHINTDFEKDYVNDFIVSMKSDTDIFEVFYGVSYFPNLNKLTTYITIIKYAVNIILLVAGLMIISNTVKLTVYNRLAEIEIMKLVGATNWFIRWPFIIEGLLQSIIGSISAVIFIFLINSIIYNGIYNFIDKETLYLIETVVFSYWFYIRLIVIGLIIGFISSYLSLNKFLRTYLYEV